MKPKVVAVLVNTLLMCNGFVLMSSLPAGSYGDIKLFQSPLTYSVDSTILLNDVSSGDKDVGYKVKCTLSVDPIWSDSATHFLLKLEVQSPKLHVRSKAAPHEGFIEHTSLLDEYQNAPFFLEWKDGIIRRVYIDTKEEPSWINYKKGLASVFQFQILDQDNVETDVSGKCDTSYHSMSATTIRKFKKNCIHDGIITKSMKNVLSTVATSTRITRYDFTEDLTAIKHIYAEELHEMRLGVKRDAGNKLRVWQELSLVDDNTITNSLKAKSFEDALQEIEAKFGFILKEQDLKMSIVNDNKKEASQNLGNVIKENRDFLKADNLGTAKSASVFIDILEVMRHSNAEEIEKALKGVKNKEILQQLCDIVGYTQTHAAHQAAKSFLNFDSEYDKDNIERYLWALSIGPRPHEKVILDVLRMSDDGKLPQQISETLLLTASAMTYNFVESRGDNSSDLMSNKVKDHITRNLSKCKETHCYITHLRALQNLRRADTVDILIDYAKKGQRSVAVMALKALRAMPRQHWTKEVLVLCRKVFYQLENHYDSSARTLAVDIILEARPAHYELEDLVDFLASQDKDFEVKQFLLQRLQMLSAKCEKLRSSIEYIIKSQKHINNYDTLAQKGQSTALMRSVSSNAWSNVSLVSVQEISGGLLKRGHVDLLLEDAGETKRLFSLGLFAGGMSSLMGSSDAAADAESAEEEPATAGMELAVLGIHIRPFTFFSGQGELMGHVWSGTASERTTAFQSLLLVQEDSEKVALGTGALGLRKLTAAASFDLAGQIQLSLWNRVAHSVVDKNAGVVVQGAFSADTPFVKSEAKFALTLEPKLELESDIDFYDGVKLCIQVKQPDSVVRHNITKVESVPQNKHMMRKSKFKSAVVPGRTYALNRKNNLMCNSIHNKQ